MNDEYAGFITCPRCGHDRNRTTYTQCEICGAPLKEKGGLPLVPLALGGVGLLALGAGAWFFLRDSAPQTAAPTDPAVVAADPTPVPPAAPTAEPAAAPTPTQAPTAANATATPAPASGGNVDTRTLISAGERLFLNQGNADKQAGVSAFANGDFATAITRLEAARTSLRNDPEVLIYLNNARVGTREAIAIATVVPLGDTASAAQELLRGVAQVQDRYNATASRPLRVLIADDRNDANQAIAIANALVADPSVTAVIGHGTSGTSLAAAAVYEAAGVVMIAPTSTTTELVGVNTGENTIYRTIPSDQFTGTALARHMLTDLGLGRVAVFYNSGNSYSQSLKNAFVSTVNLEGGVVVDEIDWASGDGLAALQATQAEVIALFPNAGVFDQAIAIANTNAGNLPVIGGDAMYRIETLQRAGTALENATIPVAWHPLRSPSPDFPGNAEQLWGGTVNWRTALSFDAAQVLTSAFEAGAIDRVAVSNQMRQGISLPNGATGEIRFLPSGDRSGGVTLVTVQPGSLSGTGFDFVPR